MTRSRRVLLPLSLLAFALVLIAGCGGAGGDDPQQVLDETFAADQQAQSGVIDVTIEGKAEGGTGGSFSLNLNGPFQGSTDSDALPQFDLTANVTASAVGQSFNFDGGLVLTTDNLYVVYQDQAYELGKSTFTQFQQLLQQFQSAQSAAGGTSSTTTTTSTATSPTEAIKQSCETAAEQNGGDPSACDDIDYSGWTTNLSNEGTTDIDGTSTIHIHGDLDISKIIQGFVQISQAASPADQSAPTPSTDQIDQVTSAITGAGFDVYTGESDHIIRGVDASFTIDPSSISGASTLGISSVTLTFTTRLSDVNQPQTIQAPANPKPISDLLGQFPSLGGLPGGGTVPGVPGIPGLPPSTQ